MTPQSTEDRERQQERQRGREDSDRTWMEYRQLVLSELERLNQSIIDMGGRLDRNYHDYSVELSKIKIDIAMLQVKSGLWGAAAGAIITIGAVIIRYIGVH